MTILNLQVASGTDDCRRQLSNDVWSLTDGVVYGGKWDGVEYKEGSGLRFQNVTIPQGSVIANAYLTFTADASRSGTVCNTEISAENVDNAPTFANDKAAFDSRYANHTTAKVDWDNIGAWVADSEYNSPDISSVIQEIVNRPGWSSGNAIVIFWEDFDDESTIVSGNPHRRAYSYEGSSTKAAQLAITYTTGEIKTSNESGGGIESLALRELGIAEAGNGIEQSQMTALVLADDAGSGSEIGGLLKGLFGQDEGSGLDSIRILTTKAGHDLRLHSYQGQVGIPHKEVRL